MINGILTLVFSLLLTLDMLPSALEKLPLGTNMIPMGGTTVSTQCHCGHFLAPSLLI